MSRNDRAREQARARGAQIYSHEVIETWPGCVTCGSAIRWNVEAKGPGLHRRCRCPGVVWRCVLGEWERMEHTDTPPS